MTGQIQDKKERVTMTKFPKRSAQIARKTRETAISADLNLDGRGQFSIKTPIPFFTHMLETVAKHGAFDLQIRATGDVEVDYHHLVEDVGLVLGDAFRKALGDKKGIARYGHFTLPMDEVLTTVALDFCERPVVSYKIPVPKGRIRDFDIELVPEFYHGFAQAARINLHILCHYGRNKHHIVESTFKAFARALSMATQRDPRLAGIIPSTKGSL